MFLSGWPFLGFPAILDWFSENQRGKKTRIDGDIKRRPWCPAFLLRVHLETWNSRIVSKPIHSRYQPKIFQTLPMAV